MKPIRFIPILFFLVNITVGASLGVLFSPHNQKTTQQSAIPTLANEQRTILLIVVDHLEEDASLVAAWTLIYAPNLRSPIWIPLYPALPTTDLAHADEILAAFHLTSDNRPDPAFLGLLRQNNLAWSGYVVLDGEAILEAMKFFDIATRPHSVAEWLALTSTHQQGHEAALHNQTALLDSICVSAAAQQHSFDLIKLYSRLRKHTQADIDLRLAFSEWKQFFYPGSDLKCQFPALPNELP
jgi:hypothetical protein